jgi:hypothetical protein
MHFLQVKHLISTHPLVAGRVDFEAVVDATTEGMVDDCDGECEKRKAQVWFN